MHIDQRRVTAVNLQDGRVRDIGLHRDPRGYRLSFVSKEEVVNVFLAVHDLQRLYHEFTKLDSQDVSDRPETTAAEKPVATLHQPFLDKSFVTTGPADAVPFSWSHVDWLSYN